GVIAWFATNYYGRNLLRFWELQREIQIALRTPNDGARLIELASQLYGLQAVAPSLGCFGRYDLRSAVRALESFSELRRYDSHEIADLRMRVQKCLRLQIDPNDRERAERLRRIKDASL